jgi:hypothetical protein
MATSHSRTNHHKAIEAEKRKKETGAAGDRAVRARGHEEKVSPQSSGPASSGGSSSGRSNEARTERLDALLSRSGR